MAVPALCLLWTLAATRPVPPPAPADGLEPARQEELTLLFHGALQLGQALNGVYRATEAQLTEAGGTVGLYGRTLELLGQELSQGRARAQELHRSLSDLQTEELVLQLHAKAMAQALGQVDREQQMLRGSVQRLEGRLRGAWLGPARQEFEALKAHAEEQGHIVWALAGHVQRQRREIAAQGQRLRQIRERLHTAALPHLSPPGTTTRGADAPPGRPRWPPPSGPPPPRRGVGGAARPRRGEAGERAPPPATEQTRSRRGTQGEDAGPRRGARRRRDLNKARRSTLAPGRVAGGV
ncbi:LOW QUALITY PROTEIN: angiopoietin-like protein 8, partial [Dasypus novemcinctus]|uniref:LOW QUALITY PROTEIN: angiopoietin-like protein 8 n=1 Tax=Dasypus novemcinctus TaxID=9361 RepID=UPI0039C92038